MAITLTEITLGKSPSLEVAAKQSFNNDSAKDKIRNSFFEQIPFFDFYGGGDKVPSEYLHPNVHHYTSNEIFKLSDKIIVGEYCDEGVIVPRANSIAFNQLYNCSPLISLIKGDEEYISFLHTWAIRGDSDVVDRQVKHWMETVAKFGDISETVFAPRKNATRGADTEYETAIDDITKISQKATVLTRDVIKLSGVADSEGVYFRECGYHLWDK